MLDVCLLGTGGMMPLPYRWLTALMTRFNGSQLLIDCGEGTQIALKEKGWSFKPIDVICFTHYHGDHISGLPGLLLTMGNADRHEPLTLIGPKGLERVVNSLRVIAPELPFEIKFIEITEPEQSFELNGYRLNAFKVKHNVTCYGYTIEIDRAGKFDVQRAQGQEIPKEYWKVLQKGEKVELDGRILSPDEFSFLTAPMALYIPLLSKSSCFSNTLMNSSITLSILSMSKTSNTGLTPVLPAIVAIFLLSFFSLQITSAIS